MIVLCLMDIKIEVYNNLEKFRVNLENVTLQWHLVFYLSSNKYSDVISIYNCLLI